MARRSRTEPQQNRVAVKRCIHAPMSLRIAVKRGPFFRLAPYAYTGVGSALWRWSGLQK